MFKKFSLPTMFVTALSVLQFFSTNPAHAAEDFCAENTSDPVCQDIAKLKEDIKTLEEITINPPEDDGTCQATLSSFVKITADTSAAKKHEFTIGKGSLLIPLKNSRLFLALTQTEAALGAAEATYFSSCFDWKKGDKLSSDPKIAIAIRVADKTASDFKKVQKLIKDNNPKTALEIAFDTENVYLARSLSSLLQDTVYFLTQKIPLDKKGAAKCYYVSEIVKHIKGMQAEAIQKNISPIGFIIHRKDSQNSL